MINNIILLHPMVNYQVTVYFTSQKYLLFYDSFFRETFSLTGCYSLFIFFLPDGPSVSFSGSSSCPLSLNPRVSRDSVFRSLLYLHSLCDLILYYGFKQQNYVSSGFPSLIRYLHLMFHRMEILKIILNLILSITQSKSCNEPQLFFLSPQFNLLTNSFISTCSI